MHAKNAVRQKSLYPTAFYAVRLNAALGTIYQMSHLHKFYMYVSFLNLDR